MTLKEPAEIYRNFRNLALTLDPAELGIVPSAELPTVWGAMMEVGYPLASVTLVVLADRTVSLYFGNGGGVIGGGPYDAVWQAAKVFLLAAEKLKAGMEPATLFPLPNVGQIRFNALTRVGKFTTHTSIERLETGRDPWMELFVAGNAVLTQLRLMDEQRRYRPSTGEEEK